MADQPDPDDRDRWARLRLAARGAVRNGEAAHCSALWRLDPHAGRGTVLTAHGTCAKPLAVILDNRSRLAAHVQCNRDEMVDSLVDALSGALMRRGLPRTVETDNAARGKRSPRRSTQK
jgi:hypothetical protein